MAPSMMESIVKRKCDVPLKKARAIIREAKEKIKLKQACLWSKEWEEKCLAIHQVEVERIKRSGFHNSIEPLTYNHGTNTPVCGFGILPEIKDNAPYHLSRKSTKTETGRISERRPSVAHKHRNRSKSRASSLRARQTDDLIGKSVGGEEVELFEEEQQGHGIKLKLRREDEDSLSPSSKSKKKKMREDSDLPIRKHHHRSRSKVRNVPCDDRPAVQRSKSHSKSISKYPHSHHKANEPVDKREKSRTRTKAGISHELGFEVEAAQQRRQLRSLSRHRLQSKTPRGSVEHDGEICKPSRRSTMAVASEYGDETYERERLARRMSQQQVGQRERLRSRPKPRAMSKDEFETKFYKTDLDHSGRTSKSERRRMSFIGTGAQNSPEKKSRRREKKQAHEEQLPKPQPEALPEKPLRLKPLLPRRMSSSEDDDDDISLDFEGLAFMTESPEKTSPKRMSGSSNALTRYLEILSDSSLGDFNRSKASLGSCKSSSSGKKRMVPVVRTKSGNSFKSGSSVSRRNEPVLAARSPHKTTSKLKTPNTAVASEPAKSILRNSRYKPTNKTSLKLPDRRSNTCADDFDHPEHDGKTLTSRTVSTVSTSSLDWTDSFLHVHY